MRYKIVNKGKFEKKKMESDTQIRVWLQGGGKGIFSALNKKE